MSDLSTYMQNCKQVYNVSPDFIQRTSAGYNVWDNQIIM